MKPTLLVLLVWTCFAMAVSRLGAETTQLPAAAKRKVDFHTDVAPILANHCVRCHGNGSRKGEFSIDTREELLKGGESGPAVVLGNSQESTFIELVSGVDPDRIMPADGKPLSAEQIGVLRAWIDQGLAWEAGFTFRQLKSKPLAPRRPDLPVAASGLKNPIDRLLSKYFAEKKFKPPGAVDDRLFMRRVYLDSIGLLPSPAEVQEFLKDRSPDKRAKLVHRMLRQNARYAEHWLTFWNDALRNDYRGTGYIDGGREQITGWLYLALRQNMPFDAFVRQLVSPVPGSEGFVKGIVWRGVVNASQVPAMQAAQNVSQVFLGINMKCASCHDSFINQWKLKDAYGLASIFAEDRLEMHRCDKPMGEYAAMKFLWPELGAVDPSRPQEDRLKQLASAITNERNGRLTRTMVNRLWARLMGRGLVEPVDDMDADAWNQDLLDWLAVDLAEHGYDLKHTLALIMTSEAYQMPAMGMRETDGDDYVFQGPAVRRLTGEQFADAVSLVTDVRYGKPAVDVPLVLARQVTSRAQWIWTSKDAAAKPAGRILIRKTFELPKNVGDAVIVVASTQPYVLYVNGAKVIAGSDWKHPDKRDIRAQLRPGQNCVALEMAGGAVPKGKVGRGLLVYARLRSSDADGEKMFDIASDESWKWSDKEAADWQNATFAAEGWQLCVELGGVTAKPWNIGDGFVSKLARSEDAPPRLRASLVNADPLLTAMGRPNREQVVTERPKVATTLQALEMTNGATLSLIIKQAADRLTSRSQSADTVVSTMYQRAFGREPSADELQSAAELVGSPPTAPGIEDLLWSIVMHPEFQLIY